jgi:hypothetical protein
MESILNNVKDIKYEIKDDEVWNDMIKGVDESVIKSLILMKHQGIFPRQNLWEGPTFEEDDITKAKNIIRKFLYPTEVAEEDRDAAHEPAEQDERRWLYMLRDGRVTQKEYDQMIAADNNFYSQMEAINRERMSADEKIDSIFNNIYKYHLLALNPTGTEYEVIKVADEDDAVAREHSGSLDGGGTNRKKVKKRKYNKYKSRKYKKTTKREKRRRRTQRRKKPKKKTRRR